LVGTILSQGKVGWEFARLIFVFAGSRKVVLGQRPAKEEAAAKAAAAKQEAAAKAKERRLRLRRRLPGRRGWRSPRRGFALRGDSE